MTEGTAHHRHRRLGSSTVHRRRALGRTSAIATIALAALLLSCSSTDTTSNPIDGLRALLGKPSNPFDTLHTTIDERVDDSARAEVMHEAAIQIENHVDELVVLTSETGAELRALVADHSSLRDEFDRLFDDYLARRAAISSRLLDLHLEIKSQATTEEWQALKEVSRSIVRRVAADHLAPGPEA